MAIRSISDFYNFSLFIFDLDNTIYNEEDYLFKAYRAIAERFEIIAPGYNKNEIYRILTDLFRKQGREKLFDKFLGTIGLNTDYLAECLGILRSFKPGKLIEPYIEVRNILSLLEKHDKTIYVLTNGNIDQQKNKIKNINWHGLDKSIHFVLAGEVEPKPSPAGVEHILKISGFEKDKTVMIGDSEIDYNCAINSGIKYFDIEDVKRI